MTNDQYLLLKACQSALNQVTNQWFPHPIYKDTYQLASAVDKELAIYEEFKTSAKVGEQYMEDADCEPIITDTSDYDVEKDYDLEKQTLRAYGFNDI